MLTRSSDTNYVLNEQEDLGLYHSYQIVDQVTDILQITDILQVQWISTKL